MAKQQYLYIKFHVVKILKLKRWTLFITPTLLCLWFTQLINFLSKLLGLFIKQSCTLQCFRLFLAAIFKIYHRICKLWMKSLSLCQLNLVSSISRTSPFAQPCISKKLYFISLSCNCCMRVANRIFNHMEAEQKTSTAKKTNNPGRIQEVTLL